MLEKNFSSLDDDFITLWSTYLVNHKYKEISSNLQKLAELGQVNAIQSWYLWNKPGTNDVIDENCKNLSNDSNSLYAKANYHYLGFMEWFRDTTKSGGPTVTIIATDYVQYLSRAIDLAKIEYQESQNPLILERYLEMNLGKPFAYNHEPTRKKEAKIIQNTAMSLRQDLIKILTQHPNTQIEFGLAKNLYFFMGSNKTKQRGLSLLSALSKREFSEQLTNYSCCGKKVETKENEEEDDFNQPFYPITPQELGL